VLDVELATAMVAEKVAEFFAAAAAVVVVEAVRNIEEAEFESEIEPMALGAEHIADDVERVERKHILHLRNHFHFRPNRHRRRPYQAILGEIDRRYYVGDRFAFLTFSPRSSIRILTLKARPECPRR